MSLVVASGYLIWNALHKIYPEAEEQHCWNHRIVNPLAEAPSRYEPIPSEGPKVINGRAVIWKMLVMAESDLAI